MQDNPATSNCHGPLLADLVTKNYQLGLENTNQGKIFVMDFHTVMELNDITECCVPFCLNTKIKVPACMGLFAES